MRRIIGIVLIVVGIISGAYAVLHHEEDKTLLEIGDVKIKNENKKADSGTTMYYIIAAIGVIGGGVLLSGKK